MKMLLHKKIKVLYTIYGGDFEVEINSNPHTKPIVMPILV